MAEAQALAYTYEFVRRALPPRTRRILEVGCGDGALAERLASDGFSLVAVDGDEGAVAAARARGVDARLAEWPRFGERGFDAVLFTRSLHHMRELEASVAAAFDALNPGGRVIVEDFEFDFADERTLGWFAGLVRVVAAAGVSLAASEFLSALAAGEKAPIDAWHEAHHHHLHGAEAIELALRARTSNLRAERAAYFFRYVAQAAPEAEALLSALLRHEIELIAGECIEPLGRRFVAER